MNSRTYGTLAACIWAALFYVCGPMVAASWFVGFMFGFLFCVFSK